MGSHLPVTILANDFFKQKLSAKVVKVSHDGIWALLKLEERIRHKETDYLYAVARPRNVDTNIVEAIKSKSVGFGVTWIPVDRFDQTKPFDLSWWRGGPAALADIKLRHD